MKLAIADNCALKFCRDLKEHWEQSHEVRYEIGASEHLAQWADVYYIDWWDNNIHYLWNWYREHPEARKPKIICRVIDWDFWCAYVPVSQQYVDFVDEIVTIAPHIYDEVKKSADVGNKLHLIRPGVDLGRFTVKQQPRGYNVVMATGDIWQMKNVMEGLMLFAMVNQKYPDKPWHLYWRGQYADHARYMKVAVEHFIKSRGLEGKVDLVGPVGDMNAWLEQMDYAINPSIKEAFSYSIAEPMCKGIKPIINNWYGAEDIWPKEYLYNTLYEAVEIFDGPYEPAKYREFIENAYSNERMFKEFDALL